MLFFEACTCKFITDGHEPEHLPVLPLASHDTGRPISLLDNYCTNYSANLNPMNVGSFLHCYNVLVIATSLPAFRYVILSIISVLPLLMM